MNECEYKTKKVKKNVSDLVVIIIDDGRVKISRFSFNCPIKLFLITFLCEIALSRLN